MEKRYEVCPAEELRPGERKIVEPDGLPHSIGVFNVDGEYHAIANVCPHQLAPLCEGRITGEMTSDGVGNFRPTRDGEVIQCPWHGWKFDITDGTSLFNPHEVRTRTYDTAVETPNERLETYGTELEGDEPPVDTYDVHVEEATVVVYL